MPRRTDGRLPSEQTSSVFARTADVRQQPSENAYYPLGPVSRNSQMRPEHRPFTLQHDARVLQRRYKPDGSNLA